jgi:hypothetical protein
VGSQKSPLLPKAAGSCAVIYEPSTGCPRGYVKDEKPIFTERDGTREFACMSSDTSKESCIDVLMPGESMGMEILIQQEPKKPAKKI